MPNVDNIQLTIVLSTFRISKIALCTIIFLNDTINIISHRFSFHAAISPTFTFFIAKYQAFVMMTIISGTNRHDSMSLRVAGIYYQFILALGVPVQLLSLQDVNVLERGSELLDIEKRFLIPADKFIFVLPEYNGSIPGILKLMMDNSDIKKCWWHKKAMLVGVADGRAGNLRGLDHMTNILNYLKVNVFYNKVPISRVNSEVDNEGHLLKPATEKVIRQQIEEFLQF